MTKVACQVCKQHNEHSGVVHLPYLLFIIHPSSISLWLPILPSSIVFLFLLQITVKSPTFIFHHCKQCSKLVSFNFNSIPFYLSLMLFYIALFWSRERNQKQTTQQNFSQHSTLFRNVYYEVIFFKISLTPKLIIQILN